MLFVSAGTQAYCSTWARNLSKDLRRSGTNAVALQDQQQHFTPQPRRLPPKKKKKGEMTRMTSARYAGSDLEQNQPTGNLNDLDKSGNHFLTTCSRQESIHCLPAECGCSNLLLHIPNSSHLWSCTQNKPHNNRESAAFRIVPQR